MSKKGRERSLADNEAKAVARMLRVSPQKLNLLAQLIRGKKVATALADLEFSRKRIARDVRKCLESAIANAENNHDLDVDDLVVVEAHVGKALVIKRHSRARAAAWGGFSSRSPTSPSWCARSRRRPSGRTRRGQAVRRKIMGQKVNPVGLRLGINRTWDSRWYAGKTSYGSLLHEDMEIRKALMAELKQAAVSKIVIERPHKKCRVTIHSARPGVVIGKKGADIEKLRRKVAALTDSDVVINIVEIRKPELDAQLVAESIAQQLERRVAFRRAMKRAVQSAMRLGAGGIRINCSGRLGGAEIARMEWYREGRVPLHTLRADVDYGIATAFTTYGTCGVKVWIFKGEIMEHDPMAQDKKMAEGEAGRPRRDAA